MGGIDVADDAYDMPALADGEVDLGARLKDLRKRKRWTLQQAADRTGVGLSTLSKIERNELSPTFSTLQKIAAGFEMDPAAIIGGQTAAPVLRVPGRRALTRAGEGRPFPTGTCNNAWLCPDLTHKVMTPIKTTIVARSIDEYPEWARYEAEMFLYVLSGTVVIHSQIYEPLRLGAGDSLYYDASTPHLWVSEGDTDAEVLWVYAKYQ
ncbi:helix-turn-helix domain-containing protein [Azospirillum rugosum]|uniref:Transcriptional regulator with XRE-family HTH domain n=1 Tax=Azospirillum rugosum TaxID=416170 RepID=A0ABS4SMA9_9PROT|nr:XRE family transcriptional regulator [Azospirillum rugosum]MBP2293702.1 transcriptional regulator with XRE-family HTH domain [Azospirillum rugosum]MDQ0527247.1 transcriptional regulator with XRE-family HTH domain [Azospirillum rugosum]